ncbi:transposase [bacterium]|nr:transposase [bacterium]
MPRKPRFNLAGVPQHVIQRGNNREPCFYSFQDYQHYLEYLKVSALNNDCRIHAYVLMKNQVHLLVTPMSENGIPQMMHALGGRYVKYINATHKRTGRLWEGRYKASLVDSDMYLLTCMCYIELNPVRAGMVEHPAEYQWSSYQHNAQNPGTDFIEIHPVFSMLGDTAEERMFVYRGLFQRYIENDVIHKIRDSLNKELVLGGPGFKDMIEDMKKRKNRSGKPGRPCVE